MLPSTAAPRRFVTDSSRRRCVRSLLARLAARRAAARSSSASSASPLALEDASGKLFPASNRARDVRDGLLARARARGVGLRFGSAVTAVERRGGGWRCARRTPSWRCDRVVVATGGLSVPNTGSDGFGLALLAALGHTVHPTYAALTPLTDSPPVACRLAGVSLPRADRRHVGPRAQPRGGGFLFTHRGYSGPCVLDVSHVAVRSQSRRSVDAGAACRVQWTAIDAAAWDASWRATRAASATPSGAISRSGSPTCWSRGGRRPTTAARAAAARGAHRAGRALMAASCPGPATRATQGRGHRRRRSPRRGGSAARWRAGARPGCYFCGEVLDAFGPIGGHNFELGVVHRAHGRPCGRGRDSGLANRRLNHPSRRGSHIGQPGHVFTRGAPIRHRRNAMSRRPGRCTGTNRHPSASVTVESEAASGSIDFRLYFALLLAASHQEPGVERRDRRPVRPPHRARAALRDGPTLGEVGGPAARPGRAPAWAAWSWLHARTADRGRGGRGDRARGRHAGVGAERVGLCHRAAAGHGVVEGHRQGVEVNVEEGMAVREGQVLARLDDSTRCARRWPGAGAARGGAPRASPKTRCGSAEAQRAPSSAASSSQGGPDSRRPTSTRRRPRSIR